MNLNNLLEIATFSPRLLLFPNADIRHLPFAAWLIKEIQPTFFVELGFQISDTYFATCQSISEAGLPTKCFAVNSSSGDENSPSYDETNANAKAHNQAHYPEFSQLLQKNFDEVLSTFSDGSIGLIHLNNLKTYGFIIHTLEGWLQKLTPDAIFMVSGINTHDTNSKEDRLWKELQIRYPSNILFPKNNGIGVFQLNNAPIDNMMAWLLPNSAEQQHLIKFFESLGSRLQDQNEFSLLKNKIIEQDKQIANLTQKISERDLAIAERDQAVAGNDGQVLVLKQLITKLSIEITRIIQSKSWKITKPLRSFRRKLDDYQKNYSDDHSLISLLKSDIVQNAGLPMVSGQNQDYVPLLKCNLQLTKTARVLVFHNPQNLFPPENCKSDLDGINGQLPGKNTCSPLTKSVWRDQIKLAKLYGIEGICFNCYWSETNQHRETEINNYLKNADLDLPFCSSWANESLGWQSDTEAYTDLKSQQHRKNKDIAFIQHVSAYFSDPRHIRMDNKPLLLVYFPDLQPSVQEMVKNWRVWCKAERVEEVYLGYVGSIGAQDPTQYGFDVAIEFPQDYLPFTRTSTSDQSQPNDSKIIDDIGGGQETSRNYDKPTFKHFRTVCPITGSNTIDGDKTLPVAYQEWLFNAINDTTSRFAKRDERIVLVNPRNKYSDIDFLKPDPHYGFAYLEATRMALVRSDAINRPAALDDKKPIAVVIHVFYETILEEILDYLNNISAIPLKVYLTTSVDLFETVQHKLKRLRRGFYLLPVSNRGRDMLPFLKIMPEVIAGGHDVLIKVHSKKSIHREDGDVWRKDVFDKLLTDQGIKANIGYLANNPEVGILGPDDHIIPMKGYAGKNAVRMTQLAARLGIEYDEVQQLNFVAGSMFFARTKAILPLVNITMSEIDFEAEAGQLDGTLAHALERMFPVSAFSIGLRTCSPDNKVTKKYKFTKKAQDLNS